MPTYILLSVMPGALAGTGPAAVGPETLLPLPGVVAARGGPGPLAAAPGRRRGGAGRRRGPGGGRGAGRSSGAGGVAPGGAGRCSRPRRAARGCLAAVRTSPVGRGAVVAGDGEPVAV